MKSLALLFLALAFAACGEPAADVPSEGGDTSPAATPGTLTERAEPLAVGDVAPAFPGLPEGGKTVLVFYRGPW